MDPEAGERVGGLVVGVEQVDRERCEEGELLVRREDAGRLDFVGVAGEARVARQLAGGQAREAAGGGEGDEAVEPRALGAGVEDGGEAALAAVQRRDPRCVEQDGPFGGEEPSASRDRLGPRRERERHVEHRRAGGPLEDGRRDAHLEAGPHGAGLIQALSELDASLHGFAGGGEDLGPRARAGRDDEGPARELGLRAECGVERQVRDQQTRHPRPPRRRGGPVSRGRGRGRHRYRGRHRRGRHRDRGRHRARAGLPGRSGACGGGAGRPWFRGRRAAGAGR